MQSSITFIVWRENWCGFLQRASRPWDSGRDGFVMGEGAGVLVMESLEHAQARGAHIICEYLGGAITCDAHHMTDPRADGLGVSSCIELALKDSGVERDAVSPLVYVSHCGGIAEGKQGYQDILRHNLVGPKYSWVGMSS